jgi:hypothetical protein
LPPLELPPALAGGKKNGQHQMALAKKNAIWLKPFHIIPNLSSS